MTRFVTVTFESCGVIKTRRNVINCVDNQMFVFNLRVCIQDLMGINNVLNFGVVGLGEYITHGEGTDFTVKVKHDVKAFVNKVCLRYMSYVEDVSGKKESMNRCIDSLLDKIVISEVL